MNDTTGASIIDTGSHVTVADYLVNRIAQDDIETVFGVTGGGIMYLIDALARSDKVRFRAMHHEEFAGVAADAYGRSGKKYGVAFATTGPGAAHLFAALTAAWQDSSPVLFVVGQVKTSDSSKLRNFNIRQNGTFELDTTVAFTPYAKHVAIASSAVHAVKQIERAIQLSTQGRPGPTVIELPLDIQGQAIGKRGYKAAHRRRLCSRKASAMAFVQQKLVERKLRTHLTKAQRPIFLFGAGVVRAGISEDFHRAIKKLRVPYVVTQFARELGDLDDSYYIGSPGIKANRSANLAIVESDLIVAVGTSLHQQVIGWDTNYFRSLPSQKIWFELDKDVLRTRKHLVDYAVSSTSQDVVSALCSLSASGLPALLDSRIQKWRQRCQFLRRNFLLYFPSHREVEGQMCLYQAVSLMSRFSSFFSAVVTDAGVVWYALAQHFFPASGTRYISSGSFGAMGMALPMAVGAASATGRPVLCVTGDGSLMTSLSELASLRVAQLPVVLVVNNNQGYLSIRSTHNRLFEGRCIGTDSSNGVFIPRLDLIAKTFNLDYIRAHDLETLEAALDRFTQGNQYNPLVIELVTFPDQEVAPRVETVISPEGVFIGSKLSHMVPEVDVNDE